MDGAWAEVKETPGEKGEGEEVAPMNDSETITDGRRPKSKDRNGLTRLDGRKHAITERHC